MAAAIAHEEQEEQRGFSFELCRRNEYLGKQGVKLPGFLKTGTTIVGAVFKVDGVVLGADTRATNGAIVADKNCEKIHYMAPNIYCCGAGTAADTAFVTEMVSGQLALHRQATGRQSRVVSALTILKQHLFNYQGHISAALVLGGMDVSGPQLYTIYPHGSTDRLPFGSMGSGSLAAMAILESQYKEGMTMEEGVALVSAAIRAGIFNDLGSGSNVDINIITKDGVEVRRNFEKPTPRTYRGTGYKFPPGTTKVLTTRVQDFRRLVTVVDGDSMEE
ncbi:unnamed protein product [Closterium sp. Naga37s-1]|nr:unnamed protein product [Closterium sp. Naga37s-1]